MRNRFCFLTWAAFLGMASLQSLAIDKPEPQVKTQAKAVGLGHSAKLTLGDGTQIRGKLIAIEDSSISIDEGKKKGTSTVSYAEIASVHRDGLTRGQKIGVGVGATLAGGGAVGAIWWAHWNQSLNNSLGCSPAGKGLGCFPPGLIRQQTGTLILP